MGRVAIAAGAGGGLRRDRGRRRRGGCKVGAPCGDWCSEDDLLLREIVPRRTVTGAGCATWATGPVNWAARSKRG